MSLMVSPGSRNQNYYDLSTGQIVCQLQSDCLHEFGHKIDFQNNWISKSPAWKKSIDIYRSVVWQSIQGRDFMSERIVFFPGIGASRIPDFNPVNTSFWEGGWGGYTELYAEIYAWSDGDVSKIPPSLQSFYGDN